MSKPEFQHVKSIERECYIDYYSLMDRVKDSRTPQFQIVDIELDTQLVSFVRDIDVLRGHKIKKKGFNGATAGNQQRIAPHVAFLPAK